MEGINNNIENENLNQDKIYLDIDNWKKKNIKIITQDMEDKISNMLSLLDNNSEKIENKLKIFNFFHYLFTEIQYNMDIINNFTSSNNLSLYTICIKEFFNSNSENEKYKNEILSVLDLLIKNLTCNHEVYEYLFSLITHYINILNNNEEKENENDILTSDKFHNFLVLISYFYLVRSNFDFLTNYLYFNGNPDCEIKVNNKNQILNFQNEEILNILIFFFLKLNPEENKQLFSKNISKLINIKLSNGNNIFLNIDMENILTGSFTHDTLYQFKKNEINSILLKCQNKNGNLKLEIYINNKKIDYKLDKEISLISDKKISDIEYLSFFKSFTGICTSIIIYKNDYNNNTLKIFENKEKNIYRYGIFNEELLNKFNKNDLLTYFKYSIIEDNQEDTILYNTFYGNLISIYIPSRFEIEEENENRIFLRDSISLLDAELITENSKTIGIHIFEKKVNNLFSIDGINSLLPILEFMIENNEILTQKNLNEFFLILGNVFYSDNKNNILNQKEQEFFTCLSLFLEKIPDQFFNDDTKGIFLTLSNSIVNLLNENDFNLISISNQYHNEIFLNENILTKFSFQNQKLLIKQLINIKNLKKKSIKIKTQKIISLILIYDDLFNYKYCCKEHASYFKNEDNIEIRDQEINGILEEISYLIDLIYKIDFEPDINDIFKILTKKISPCTQNIIIKIFSNFLNYSQKQNKIELFQRLNTKNIILDISLSLLENSLFDVRIKLLVFIFELLENLEPKNNFIDLKLDIPQILIFIENNIIPKYYIIDEVNDKEDQYETIKHKIEILDYQKIKLNKIDKEYLKYINKDHFQDLLSNLLTILNNFFRQRKYISYIIPLIISISPKSEIENLYASLYILNKEKEQSDLVKNIILSNNSIHFILETYFQSFIYLKNKDFKIPFIINESHNSYETTLNFMTQIYKNGNELIIYILTKDIKKIDYILLWGKYYCYLFSDNEILYNILREFINQIFQNAFNIIEIIDKLEDFEKNVKKSDFIYYCGTLFEFFTFYKIDNLNKNINEPDIKLKQFVNLFYDKLISNEKKTEKNISIEDKWNDYTNFKTMYSNCFYKLWNDIFWDKLDQIFNYYLIKKEEKNKFIKELKYIYFSFEQNKLLCNNGIKIILLLFHYLILLIVNIENESDIEYWNKHFQQFIIFIIISCGNLDKKEKYYIDYNNKLTESILYYSIYILINQINERKSNINVKYYYSCLGNILYICFKMYNHFKEEKIKEKNKKASTKFINFLGFKEKEDDFSLTFPVKLFDDCFKNSETDLINIILNCKDEFYNNEINKILNDKNFMIYFIDNQNKLNSVLKEIFPFIEICENREKEIHKIIPCYKLNFSKENIISNPDYEKKNKFKQNEMIEKVSNLKKGLDLNIQIEKIKDIYHKALKIKKYKKFKKNLFRFNNFWSTKEFFYNKNKYHLCYKIKYHLTDEYTRILLTPIIDIEDYYPKFSQFDTKKLFKQTNLNLKPIHKIVNLNLNKYLSLVKKEKKENKKPPYLLKLNSTIKQKYNIESLARNFILKEKFEYNQKDSSLNIKKCCLIFHNYHIQGLFYINKEEIGFYSFEFERNVNDEDYDEERKYCFGSIFKSQEEKTKFYHICIPYNEIELIFKRRYIYKRNSMEIFSSKKKSYFFKFEDEIENIITDLKNYLDKNKHYLLEEIYIDYNKYYSNIGYINKSNIKYSNIEKNSLNLVKIYENWKNYKISTLKLIMILNIYSNRTYNDLNQYPIFPWIYIDYENPNFEIKKEKLRPFDTPMGMLEISKESIIRKNDYLNHWSLIDENDMINDNIGRYGSHYSTSLYVSYYLVRTLPFAFDRIELQGKTFDDPNRLFNDFLSSFNCASTQKSDLRELIPEIFCFPELFINSNDFYFGEILNVDNNKYERVQNVVLPKWCNNNEYDFIYKHRMCLESKDVSLNINEWFDLIFGYYQKGEKAKEKHNLFSCFTYEDYDNIYIKEKDIKQKKYYSRMIEFGITPNQIFKNTTSPRLNFEEIENKNFKFQITNNDENFNYEIVNIINNYNLVCNDFLYLKYVELNNNKFKLFVICLTCVYSFEINRKRDKKEENENFRLYTLENLTKYNLIKTKFRINKKKPPIILFGKGEYIAMGGYWNGNIIIQKLIKDINNNLDFEILNDSDYPINNIIIDKNDHFCICSNIKGNIFIYKINDKNKWNLYKEIHNCHNEIICMNLNEQLNIFVTYSKDNLCMIYTYPKFNLVNSFKLYNDNSQEVFAKYFLISYSPLPSYLFYCNNKFLVYSINGQKFLEKKCNNIDIIKIFTNYYSQDFIYFNENNSIKILNMPVLYEIHSINFNSEIIDMDISFDNSFICILTKENNKSFSIKIFKNKKTKV